VEKISEFSRSRSGCASFRLKAFEHFLSRPQPTWGSPMLAEVDYDDIHYFVRASERAERSWTTSPTTSRRPSTAWDPRGGAEVPVGVGAQYESEVVYHQINESLTKQGVIFTDMTPRCANTRTGAGVLRHDHPGQ